MPLLLRMCHLLLKICVVQTNDKLFTASNLMYKGLL